MEVGVISSLTTFDSFISKLSSATERFPGEETVEFHSDWYRIKYDVSNGFLVTQSELYT